MTVGDRIVLKSLPFALRPYLLVGVPSNAFEHDPVEQLPH